MAVATTVMMFTAGRGHKSKMTKGQQLCIRKRQETLSMMHLANRPAGWRCVSIVMFVS